MVRLRKIFIISLLFLFIFISPALSYERVKFINFSDIHLSINGENTMKMGKDSVNIAQLCVNIANQTPNLDFVIFTGDLLQDGEPWNLDKFKEIFDNLKVPYYVIIGNHDYSPVNAKFASISKNDFIWAFQGHGFNGNNGYWSLDPVQGLHLTGLDTTMVGTWGGELFQTELNWLENDLKNNKDKLSIVLAHHNFVCHLEDDKGKMSNFVASNASQVRNIFEKNNVKFVISGHHHITSVVEMNGVYYFSNPSTTSYPCAYTVYEIEKNTFKYTTLQLPLSKQVLEEAKKNLLADEWWRPQGASDKEMLIQFEGEEKENKGAISF